jgi:hypothetical protein
MSDSHKPSCVRGVFVGMNDQFDFWLGTWQGTWKRDGEQGKAVNTITKEYAGNVVVERFVIDAPEAFNGFSVSVFDQGEACWKQTWVDDSGAYLDFRGGFDGEQMALTRQFVVDGVPFTQRMVWRDIERDRFAWLWQRVRSSGDWETMWAISYERTA